MSLIWKNPNSTLRGFKTPSRFFALGEEVPADEIASKGRRIKFLQAGWLEDTEATAAAAKVDAEKHAEKVAKKAAMKAVVANQPAAAAEAAAKKSAAKKAAGDKPENGEKPEAAK